MIAAWMLYASVVTLFLGVGARLLERACRLAGRPARFVWASAMIAALIVSSGVGPVLGGRSRFSVTVTNSHQATVSPGPSAKPSTTNGFLPGAVFIEPHSFLSLLDRPLLAAWALAALAWLLVLAISATRVLRARRQWTEEIVNGVPVLVSHDVGPAVLGIVNYSIVVPRWVLATTGPSRDLIISHEREHVRAADPALLLFGAVTLLLMPWNVGLWYMMRRLRLATELDCDQRVLQTRPDALASYGSLLLDVSERTVGGAVPVLALSEPAAALTERIESLSARRPRYVVARLVGAMSGGLVLVALACVTPRPYATLPPGERAGALVQELEAVLTADSTRARVSLAQLAEVRKTLGQVLDATDPYYKPRDEYLRDVARHYYPELTTHPERSAAIAIVFDARDSVIAHAAGVRSARDKSCEDVVKSLLPAFRETRFESGGCMELDAHWQVVVYWGSMRNALR